LKAHHNSQASYVAVATPLTVLPVPGAPVEAAPGPPVLPGIHGGRQTAP
jgi:hypothetical protein